MKRSVQSETKGAIGRVYAGGHEVSMASRVQLDLQAGSLPVVTLECAAFAGLVTLDEAILRLELLGANEHAERLLLEHLKAKYEQTAACSERAGAVDAEAHWATMMGLAGERADGKATLRHPV